LLPGFGSSTYTWRHVLPALADRYRLYALDLPPFGFAERVCDPIYSVRWLASLVRDFCALHELRPVAVVGQSLGGVVALQLAHDDPALVSHLALVAPAVFRWGGDLPLRALRHVPSLARAILYLAFGSPARIRRQLLDVYADATMVTADAVLAMAASPRADDLPGGLSRIVAPVLLVWGERDRVVPASDATPLRALLPAAELHIMPNV